MERPTDTQLGAALALALTTAALKDNEFAAASRCRTSGPGSNRRRRSASLSPATRSARRPRARSRSSPPSPVLTHSRPAARSRAPGAGPAGGAQVPRGRRDLREGQQRVKLADDRAVSTGIQSVLSQTEPDLWHAVIGEETAADSICDRLAPDAHRVKLSGEPIRKSKSSLNGQTKSAK